MSEKVVLIIKFAILMMSAELVTLGLLMFSEANFYVCRSYRSYTSFASVSYMKLSVSVNNTLASIDL